LLQATGGIRLAADGSRLKLAGFFVFLLINGIICLYGKQPKNDLEFSE
jgi:hypothetical protein